MADESSVAPESSTFERALVIDGGGATLRAGFAGEMDPQVRTTRR